MSRRVGWIAAASTALAAGVAAPAAGTADAVAPAIAWHDCWAGWGTKCATVRVPLDYDNPRGATLLLDLVKMPATGPQPRIGTVFVNPGGPGVRATDFVDYASRHLGPTVTARYDVIGIDPRGVGQDSMMLCHNDNPEPTPAPPPFPVTWTQSAAVWRSAQWVRTGCKENPNPIVAHMSTADTARDMDLIRRALGEPRLNYYGASYGTYLGATYASMFPDRVRRMVLDGVVDPVAWATGATGEAATLPVTTRVRGAEGAYTGLVAALRECDRLGRRQCAFAGNAPGKWRQLLARAKAGGLQVNERRMTYPALVQSTLGMMYEDDYSLLAQSLQAIWVENFRRVDRVDPRLVQALDRASRRVDEQPYAAPSATRGPVTDTVDAFHGVACADSRNPRERIDWWRAGQDQDKQYPWFGSVWTWRSATCGNWPIVTKEDTWFRPFGGRTSGPILVVGNTYDPATPIHGARAVVRRFDRARLLTYAGWGHTAIGNSCVTAAFDTFFASGVMPAPGAVCRMDGPLFSGG